MQSFGFVMNVASLGAESFTLAPGHVLRRAASDEITFIKSTVEGLGGSSDPYRKLLWEGQWPVTYGRRVEDLPDSKWRYFVIEFEGSNAVGLSDIQVASDLAPVELEIGFHALFNPTSGNGIGLHQDRFFQVLAECELAMHKRDAGYFVKVSGDAAEDIAKICAQLRSEDRRIAEVKSAANRIGDLKTLPSHSPLRFLGYFAILESLLTRPPSPSDPYDSITRQVQTKLALLNNRFDRKIDYSRFRGAAAETVWARMYAYRSSLAHGSVPSFVGDLSILESHARALWLLKHTVKAVIRHALVEPQLILDLRDC